MGTGRIANEMEQAGKWNRSSPMMEGEGWEGREGRREGGVKRSAAG